MKSEKYALSFALSFPTFVTWMYFVWLAGSPAGIQQTAYSVGKILQFAFPVMWVVLIARERVSWTFPQRPGVMFGMVFGATILGLAMVVYHGWLEPLGLFDKPTEVVRKKVLGMGLNSIGKYAAVAVFYSIAHSAMEEYYWRWFVFGRLSNEVTLPWAIALSSMGFMAHHVIVLATFFGWTSPLTYLLSSAVAIGGAFWAWLYHRSRSLYGPWLSHMLVDAAIFAIGYDLVRGGW